MECMLGDIESILNIMGMIIYNDIGECPYF